MPSISESGSFLRKLKEGFKSAGISRDHSIVCAVSGGPDSTALLLGSRQLGRQYKTLSAAHFNHRARGEDSDRDEEFVRAVCADADIPLQVGRSRSRPQKLDENTARTERYRFLAQVADSFIADAIVIAHTVDDQAETVLLRIVRGAGIQGAGAMRPSRSMRTPTGRDVNIARPMLQITRAEVNDFLGSTSVTARHDSSNDDWRAYARNRVRHRVLPELEAINFGATSAIARFATILRANAELLDDLTDDALMLAGTASPNVLIRSRITELHPVVQAAVLTRVYRSVAHPDLQLDQNHIDKITDLLSTGKSSSYHLPGGIIFRSDHQFVRIESSDEAGNDVVPYPRSMPETLRLPIPGNLDLGTGYRIESSFSALPSNYREGSRTEAWLTPELVDCGYLSVRNREPTDRFNPLGMDQEVNLSDFLINSKVAASWRDRVPLVVSPIDGRIAWLPSIRPAEWAKILPSHETALHLRLIRDDVGDQTARSS